MEGLRQLPDSSIDCVITSPPYWQLRDYGYDGQWGLEDTFEKYLEHLWGMMDEIHRILKDTGTVWINLGDTYSTKSGGFADGDKNQSKVAKYTKGMVVNQPGNLPPKSLLMIPHRFAIGCYNRGWTIRNDIVWAKKNAMPESVEDRFSKKHEYFFFMTKKPTGYYFDLESVKDQQISSSGKKNPGDVADFWDIPTRPSTDDHYAAYNTNLIDKPIISGCPEGGVVLDPFAGTGTTLIRARELCRQYVGIEYSKEFCDIIDHNISNKLVAESTMIDRFFE